jgi:hypothetical protein
MNFNDPKYKALTVDKKIKKVEKLKKQLLKKQEEADDIHSLVTHHLQLMEQELTRLK